MMTRLLAVLVLAATVVLGGTGTAPAGPSEGDRDGRHGRHLDADDLPDRLDLPDGWQPEGVTAGRRLDLYVGSIPTGAIARVNAATGETRTVVAGGAGRAAIGIKYDRRRDRLFVAGGPTGKAFVYSARTGEELAQFQLAPPGEPTFVNDVVLTRRAAYFTDSRRSVIYAVGTRLRAARTIELPGFPLEAGNNLNGIAATAAGDTLLAVQSNTGWLWRIDPAAPSAVQVDLGETVLTNGDGLFLRGRTLYVVQNRLNQLALIRLDRQFARGTLVTTIGSAGFDVPTTITFLRGELYAVNARFGTTDPQPADYWITLVRR